MFERFFSRVGRKETKTSLSFDNTDLRDIAKDVVERANKARPNPKDRDGDLRMQLSYLAGLAEDALGDFKVDDSKDFSGYLDVVSAGGRVAFSLGLGKTSLVFFNKNAMKDGWINKLMPLEDIVSREQLENIVYGFIMLKPLKESGEIIDVNRQRLQEKMKIQPQGISRSFEGFKKAKK